MRSSISAAWNSLTKSAQVVWSVLTRTIPAATGNGRIAFGCTSLVMLSRAEPYVRAYEGLVRGTLALLTSASPGILHCHCPAMSTNDPYRLHRPFVWMGL